MTKGESAGDAGVYIAVFQLDRPGRIQVGRLGRFDFPAGFYLYVGSAQRGLSARLERHARKKKPLRWHIDYLSVRAEMLGELVAEGPRSLECELAAKLGEMFRLAVPGFGASDCRCPGHLFHTPKLP